MRERPMIWLRALPLVALIATTAQAASLPLRRGTFVTMGQSCSDAPLASLFHYDGMAFSYPHASQCRSDIVAQSGQTYTVRETCSALGDGTPAQPSTTTSTYAIISATEVRVGKDDGHGATAYRWCPAGGWFR